jgi:anti-anti-sigma regulatory factor
MNFGFSNSTADLDDDDWPVRSSPRGSLTRFAEWLRQKCTEMTEDVGLRAPIFEAGQSGSVRVGESGLLGPGSVSPALFDVDVSIADNMSTIAARGVLSATACDRLGETVRLALDQREGKIVLDLQGVEWIHMAGVHALSLTQLRASDELTELLLIPASPAVPRAIDATHGPFVYVNRLGTVGRARRRARRPVTGNHG